MKNEILFTRIKKLVSTERRIGVEILECLYEIERRKAYSELKYDGLYTYCVKELGFTESQAYQRIQAMHALKEIPELKPLIESGSLSVSSVSKVQTHLKREMKNDARSRTTPVTVEKSEKLKLFQSMENNTSREVDQKLAESRGEKLKEKLVIELDEESAELWKQVTGLSAHRNQAEKEATLKMLMREWLKRNHPAREVRSEKSQKTEPELKLQTTTQIASVTHTEQNPIQPSTSQRSVPLLTWQNELLSFQPNVTQKSEKRILNSDSRYIPLSLRREIWRRDEGKCTNCGSKHALEIDHIHAFALDGKTEKENLRLLCRSCNQFAALQTFGIEKVRSYK